MRSHLFLSVALALVLAAAGAVAAPAASERTTVIGADSQWRCFVVRGSELVRKAGGELQPLYEFSPAKWIKIKGKRASAPNEVPVARYTTFPSAGWRSPDFDDSRWAGARGPFYVFTRDHWGLVGNHLSVAMVCLRGRFHADDPADARDLRLSLEFEGGAVVYLNGKELTRSHLPKGELKPNTPAEDYPKETYVAPDGFLLRKKYGDPKKYPDLFKLRTRSITELNIPGSALRKGVNVLAVELHRAPAHEIMFTGKTKRIRAKKTWWNRIGLTSAALSAAPGSGIIPNTKRPKGFLVRNHPVISRVDPTRHSDPNEPLRPVKITGVRNGTFSGQVVVSDTKPIENLKVVAGNLTGPGTIPSSSVRIRYMLRDGAGTRGRSWFYGLESFPPKTVPIIKEAALAVQPVWITVNVPADAKPGDYRGKVTVSAKGIKSVETSIELHVTDWTLPTSRDFTTHVGLIQSPETVAMKYGVPLWSQKHWDLLEKSLELLGRVGTKVIYISMVRRTHFGNEHGMVSWIRRADGSLEPDFRIAEKYIAMAVKHLGRIPVVGVYCWEPKSSASHFPSTSGKRDLSAGGDRDILISVRAGADGKLEEAVGPKWGTPESKKFWKSAMDGLSSILKKHGIEKSMMLGISNDYIPTKTCMDDFVAAAPEARWIAQSHVYWTKIHDQPVGYLASVWGIWGTRDPALPKDYYGNNRYYGWKNPFRVVCFPRTGSGSYEVTRGKPPELHRFLAEGALVSAGRPNAKPPGVRGFGRMGADFWPVVTAVRSGRGIGRGRPRPICGRYPEALAGGMALTYVKYHILSPGKDGAIATDLFEMLREGLQEAEARVFIEKALLDPAKKARLGDAMAKRCQDLLDDRVRTFMRAVGQRNRLPSDWLWYRGSDWQKQSQSLYSAAAEVRKKIK